MAINYINTGSSANKGDGDTLRSAFNKINANFRYLAESGGFNSTGSSTTLTISDVAPNTPNGTMWFNTTEARTYVKYLGVWVDASPQVTPPPTTSTNETTIITMSAMPPLTDNGSLWFNTNDARTYIKYAGSWVDSSPQVTPPPAIPDDGSGYLSKNIDGILSWTGNIEGYLSITSLKEIVASSTDFEDFKSKIAAL